MLQNSTGIITDHHYQSMTKKTYANTVTSEWANRQLDPFLVEWTTSYVISLCNHVMIACLQTRRVCDLSQSTMFFCASVFFVYLLGYEIYWVVYNMSIEHYVSVKEFDVRWSDQYAIHYFTLLYGHIPEKAKNVWPFVPYAIVIH